MPEINHQEGKKQGAKHVFSIILFISFKRIVYVCACVPVCTHIGTQMLVLLIYRILVTVISLRRVIGYLRNMKTYFFTLYYFVTYEFSAVYVYHLFRKFLIFKELKQGK